MEQLKELEFDQYLNNYKFNLQNINTSRPRLAFNNDGKIALWFDNVEPNRVTTSEFILFNDIKKIILASNGFTKLGAIYTNDYNRYVITKKDYKVISRFLYFWEKGKNK